jgi:hypothetical protein
MKLFPFREEFNEILSQATWVFMLSAFIFFSDFNQVIFPRQNVATSNFTKISPVLDDMFNSDRRTDRNKRAKIAYPTVLTCLKMEVIMSSYLKHL